MSPPFLPFALPDIGEEEIAEVIDSLRSGWITSGPKTRQFEQEFARFLGADVEAVAVNSATAGLHLALEALGIGPGDQVIVPTFTFTASAEIVRYLGADPVLVDIDPQTLCVSAQAVARAVTPRTRAIIPVHYGGLACDMDALHAIAARHGLSVVEDAAHAFPTLYRGRLVGTLDSAAAVFSFYATKTLATGEGGMLVTRNPRVAARARVMRLHGIDRDAFDRYVASRPAWRYDVVAPGFKYNMTDIAAALGRQQLARAEGFLARRTYLARRYHAAFAELPVVLPPSAPANGSHAWHLYVIRLRAEAPLGRDAFIDEMFAAGIGCSVHYVPLHLLSYWRDTYELSPESFPAAQTVWERCVSLPLYTRMSDADQDRVIEAATRLLRR